MTATTTIRTIADLGIHSLTRDPRTRSLSHSEAAPPGAPRTSSAQPAHTNDIARVTTMSGTLVRTTRAPLIAPSTRPRASTDRTTTTPHSSLWPFIAVAQTTLVRAIIDPIERSIPPPMTTTAWATAASASGSPPMARFWTPLTS